MSGSLLQMFIFHINDAWCVFSPASDCSICAPAYPYLDENVIWNSVKCFTKARLHWGVSNYNFTLYFLEVITWSWQLCIGGFKTFFFFRSGRICLQPSMRLKSHSKIGCISRWNFCPWSSNTLIDKRDFQVWSRLICHFTGICRPFPLFFDCVFPQTFSWAIFPISIRLPGVELCTPKTAPCSRTDVLARRPLSLIWKKAPRGRSDFQNLFLLAAKCFPPHPLLGWFGFSTSSFS